MPRFNVGDRVEYNDEIGQHFTGEVVKLDTQSACYVRVDKAWDYGWPNDGRLGTQYHPGDKFWWAYTAQLTPTGPLKSPDNYKDIARTLVRRYYAHI